MCANCNTTEDGPAMMSRCRAGPCPCGFLFAAWIKAVRVAAAAERPRLAHAPASHAVCSLRMAVPRFGCRAGRGAAGMRGGKGRRTRNAAVPGGKGGPRFWCRQGEGECAL